MITPHPFALSILQNADSPIHYNITPKVFSNPVRFPKSDNVQLRTKINKTLIELFEEHRTSIENYWPNDDGISLENYNFKLKREERSPPEIHMKKQHKSKLRPCNDMNGILGGANSYNYISFILAILTLVVNINNNINNNNNNLNQFNLNVADNNNANANVNNNNANVVNVMPPGRKKRSFYEVVVQSSKSSTFAMDSILERLHRISQNYKMIRQ